MLPGGVPGWCGASRGLSARHPTELNRSFGLSSHGASDLGIFPESTRVRGTVGCRSRDPDPAARGAARGAAVLRPGVRPGGPMRPEHAADAARPRTGRARVPHQPGPSIRGTVGVRYSCHLSIPTQRGSARAHVPFFARDGLPPPLPLVHLDWSTQIDPGTACTSGRHLPCVAGVSEFRLDFLR